VECGFRQCDFVNQVLDSIARLSHESPHFLPEAIVGWESVDVLEVFGKFCTQFLEPFA
jgi:hypothetical protein